MEDAQATELPEGAIPLPSGGWVRIRPEREATGKDVRRVREALNKEGDGTILNAAMTRAMEVRVAEWHIPYRPDLPIPMYQPGSPDLLRADDFMTVEGEVRDWAMELIKQQRPKDAGEPGSPRQPASE